MANRINNGTITPGASPTTITGSWFNATSSGEITAGILLLKDSTSHSMIDSDMLLTVVENNMNYYRTTFWNWGATSTTPKMTVVFHGADGPSSPRFYVCAGIDSGLGVDDAVILWKAAVAQFRSNNGGPSAYAIYTWTQTGPAFAVESSDRISHVIDQLLHDGTINTAYNEPCYTNTRWPANVTTWRFN